MAAMWCRTAVAEMHRLETRNQGPNNHVASLTAIPFVVCVCEPGAEPSRHFGSAVDYGNFPGGGMKDLEISAPGLDAADAACLDVSVDVHSLQEAGGAGSAGSSSPEPYTNGVSGVGATNGDVRLVIEPPEPGLTKVNAKATVRKVPGARCHHHRGSVAVWVGWLTGGRRSWVRVWLALQNFSCVCA
ncbi:hypothetical protein ONE63_005396 [Megalurothrips usitatus]|uniref:Uncharacterized protein n=1 Tax=Megalurothrips usitatus TaxID=439358 RepID=A0AAV7XVC1_9NEOP|nr:hypothetical protein ONE63_005396 [Megalurothrips usitatus]